MKVLIIGDSISMGYTPFVAELLEGAAEVVHNPGNGGDSSNVRAHLEQWLADSAPEIVHFNCGLHDVKVAGDAPGNQVPLPAYRENLARIVQRLVQSGALLVWANSTPVVERWHTAQKGFDRYNRDIDACNAAAEEIVRAAGIEICDLHSVISAAGPEKVTSPDGVHFPEATYRMLAEVVVTCLRRHL